VLFKLHYRRVKSVDVRNSVTLSVIAWLSLCTI